MPKTKQPPQKRGRTKNSGLRVPHWAHKAIAALSDHSGVSSQKILEVALRDGIQLVGEPLGAWVNYQKSSEKLWNENVESGPITPVREGETGIQTPPAFAIASDPDDLDIGGTEPDDIRLDDVDELRGHEAEALAIDQGRNGE